MSQLALSLLLQLCLAQLAIAAPMAEDGVAETLSNTWQYGTGGGILGFIVLVLDIMVFIEVLKSNRPGTHKVIWCLIVFLFPIVGMLIYYLFSNREAHRNGGGYEALP